MAFLNVREKTIVSVCCLTYNHVRYIRQCLDGIVMQKTKFPIEILIHDDASTDGTQDVIREYEEKYPDIIKHINQKENQYSKGVRVSLVYNYPRANGKYIAFCEGDDYWTDPYKLQKQVDFLECHPDYVMCSHRFVIYNQSKDAFETIMPENISEKGKTFELKSLIEGEWYFQPLSIVFRREALDMALYNQYKCSKDLSMIYFLLKKGVGYCMYDVMGVYRRHQNGVWTGVDTNTKRFQNLLAKISIYNVEQTTNAALYILGEFSSAMSRVWMLKHIRLFGNIVKIFFKHFGLRFTMKLFVKKFLFGKSHNPNCRPILLR